MASDRRGVSAAAKRGMLLITALTLGACSIAPKHPTLVDAELPDLVPVRDFVANLDHVSSFRVSPDGKMLLWRGVSSLRSAIKWRRLPSGPEQSVGFRKSAPRAFWAADSRHLLYHSDPSGHERHHVFALDTQNPQAKPRDLTPYKGVKAFVLRVPRRESTSIFVMHNRRDRSIFDLYEIDIVTGEETLLFQNDEVVINTLVDDEGNVVARVRQTDTERLLQTAYDGGWTTRVAAGKFDDMFLLDVSVDGRELFLISNVGRDKRGLIALDLQSGEERTVFEHPDVDVGRVHLNRTDRRPIMVLNEPDYPQISILDDRYRDRLNALLPSERGGMRIVSMDRAETKATIVTWDHSGASFYLVDLGSGEQVHLGDTSSRKRAHLAATMNAIEVQASDGMKLHGYLSLPPISTRQPLPTVVNVHGGPWHRHWWGFDMMAQFLTNRGYAVLQINYRGSRGYGRAYMHAAEGEFAGKMHTDLLDAVDWAVDQGMTDPQRVAILGGSYGGYATLVGMTMTPDRFVCGVDNVGVTDLATLLESAPPYWKPSMHLWHRFVGDPANAEQRAEMNARSPLYHADKVQGRLLIVHGENDPRVKLDQSDRMVAALREAGKDVRYIVIEDEGHGYRHWKNRLRYLREVEDFLAECLGGRSSGFDFYELGTWMF